MQRAADSSAVGPTDSVAWFHGVASWYGPAFNGRLTASGRVYDMYAMTAATSEFHTTLPLGTTVRVVNSHNGRSVVVHITDRGPLPNGRIIDLSYGAARKLAMVKPGIAHVRVHVLHWGDGGYHRGAW
jgi:rare lipoprotein A